MMESPRAEFYKHIHDKRNAASAEDGVEIEDEGRLERERKQQAEDEGDMFITHKGLLPIS